MGVKLCKHFHYLHGYCSSFIHYFIICFSLLTSLSPFQLLLWPLTSLSSPSVQPPPFPESEAFRRFHLHQRHQSLLKVIVLRRSPSFRRQLHRRSITVLHRSPRFAASFIVDLVVWSMGSISLSSFTVLHRRSMGSINGFDPSQCFTIDLVVWFVDSILLFDGGCVGCLDSVREMRMGENKYFIE